MSSPQLMGLVDNAMLGRSLPAAGDAPMSADMAAAYMRWLAVANEITQKHNKPETVR